MTPPDAFDLPVTDSAASVGRPLFSLWTRMALLVSAVVLFCFALFGVYLAHSQVRLAETEVHNLSRAITENVAASVAASLLEQRLDELERLLLHVAMIGNIIDISVADRQGKVISKVLRHQGGTAQAHYAKAPDLPLVEAATAGFDNDSFTYIMPILRGERIGMVVVRFDIDNLHQVRRSIYRNTAGASLITVILILLLLAVSLRRTVRSLQSATAFAMKLAFHSGEKSNISSNVREVQDLVSALDGASFQLASQQQDLKDSDVRKSAIMNVALDCFITIDSAGRIIDFNPAAEATFGYLASEVVGKAMDDVIVPPQFREGHRNGMARFLASGKSDLMRKRLEMTAIRRDGEIFPVELAIIPFDVRGKPYFCGYLRDMTGIKMATTALRDSMAREMETAQSIQRALLLGSVPPGLPGVSIATYSKASRGVDGDFFLIHRYHDHCFDLLVGDVMGKGLSAALIGAAVINTYSKVQVDLLTSSLGSHALPGTAALVNAMHRALTPDLIKLDAFVTLALYRFDMQAGTLSYVNGGHTPVLLRRGDTGVVESILGENLPIGVLVDEVYVEGRVKIAQGDTLLAYSDGITETSNADDGDFGEHRLIDFLNARQAAGLPANLAIESLRSHLLEFARNAPAKDDQTLVLIDLLALPAMSFPDRRRQLRKVEFSVDWNLSALTALRSRVMEAAADFPEADRHALELAAFEAASNVLRHAPQRLSESVLFCRIGRELDRVVVQLMYAGQPFSPPGSHEPDFSGDSEGGFGLFIIEQLVDAVDYGSPYPGIASVTLFKNRA